MTSCLLELVISTQLNQLVMTDFGGLDTDEEDEKDDGYCHYNDTGHEEKFKIDLWGIEITLKQLPNDREIGHGAVIWYDSLFRCWYVCFELIVALAFIIGIQLWCLQSTWRMIRESAR